MSFFAELKRRNVFKVAVAYAIVAWLLIQVIVAVKNPLYLPPWTDSFVIVLLIVGFPVALFLTWAYELTPEGVKRAEPVDKYSDSKHATSEAAALSSESGITGTKQSIAVLPFVNMSSDPEQEYFSDGISEELLNSLARIRDLDVRGRTSSFYFKGRNEGLRTISEMLKVEHLIEGSVRKAGNQVRITVQLINARTDTHLWSKIYDRSLEDIFAVQEDIAHSVADALEVTLGMGKLGRMQGMTHNMAAYEDWLTGRSQSRYTDRESYLRAIEHLEQAVSLDPDFGVAWGELAFVYLNAADTVITDREEEYLEKSEQALNQATTLAPESLNTLNAVAGMRQYHHEWAAAEKTFNKALLLTPSDYMTNFNYGLFLQYMGRPRMAIDFYQQAGKAEPLNVSPTQGIVFCYEIMGEYDQALKAIEEAKQKKVGNLALLAAQRLLLALDKGDRDLIDASLEETIEADKTILPTDIRSMNPAMRSLLDAPGKALEALHRFAKDPHVNNAFVRSDIMAAWACYFGDAELALELQYQGNKASVPHVYTLWQPKFKSMRQLPGFKDLVTKLGLVDYWRTTGKWNDFCRPVGDDDFECT